MAVVTPLESVPISPVNSVHNQNKMCLFGFSYWKAGFQCAIRKDKLNGTPEHLVWHMNVTYVQLCFAPILQYGKFQAYLVVCVVISHPLGIVMLFRLHPEVVLHVSVAFGKLAVDTCGLHLPTA